jgi:enoyl-CoA hydratase
VSDYRHLRVEVDGHVAHVVLARPPVNAVNQDMYEELRRAFSTVADLAGPIKAVILSGEGKHFCAGNDRVEFGTLDPTNAPERMLAVRRAFWAIYDCPVPVLAAVHGAALGTGLALAASCDLIIAAEGARFGLPEIGVGVMGGASHLRRLVPEPLARWMFLSGEPAPLDTLVALGAVLEVVAPDRLVEAARNRVELISRHGAVALRIAKRALNETEWTNLKPGYEFEQGRTGELSGYEDSLEARRAALERREPHYRDSQEEADLAARKPFP